MHLLINEVRVLNTDPALHLLTPTCPAGNLACRSSATSPVMWSKCQQVPHFLTPSPHNVCTLECSGKRVTGALRGVWVFHCVTMPRWGKISFEKWQRWLFLFVSIGCDEQMWPSKTPALKHSTALIFENATDVRLFLDREGGERIKLNTEESLVTPLSATAVKYDHRRCSWVNITSYKWSCN